MSVPRSATIVAELPCRATASMACRPKRVASTRSNAVGVPPRWMWPSTEVRASLPVRASMPDASQSPMPASRTWPNASSVWSLVIRSPSAGSAPSATTMIGE